MSEDFRTNTHARAIGIDDAPRGPYAMAQDCRAMIPKLDEQIATAKTKREAKQLRQRRRLCRDIVRWCETRAGYIEGAKP